MKISSFSKHHSESLIPDNLGNKLDFQELQSGKNPIIFFVNGFGGCAPCICRTLFDQLKPKAVSIYDLDWNDIYLRKQSVYTKFSSVGFINDMLKKVIPAINPERKLLFIGHSFGGDAILEIARQIQPRKICFLAILDGVKRFGRRTTASVPGNVDFFYNRWTKHSSLPSKIPDLTIPGINKRLGVAINSYKSGRLTKDSLSTSCDQKEQSYGYHSDGFPILLDDEINKQKFELSGRRSSDNRHQIITHGCKYAIYKDLYIQEEMFNIIMEII
ncbi:MAG: alpha/beta hydrolase [Cyanobacteria bacterium P01_G01_bin.19]